MNLSDIKTKLVARVNRRDFTADTALQQTFVDQAVMRIQRDLRVPAMEKSVDVTIAADYAGLVIPSDLIELIRIVPEATGRECDKSNLNRVKAAAEANGNPTDYARQAGMWVLGPAPSTNDVIRIDYYAELAPLVNPTDENIISTIAWDLIVEAALVEAWKHYKDGEKRNDAEASYQIILNALQDQADEDETNGGATVQPAYKWPDEH